MSSELPGWAREMRDLFRSGSAAQFLLHGNIFDLVPTGQRLLTLPTFLDEVMFASYDVVLRYDRSRGVRATRGGKEWTEWLTGALGAERNPALLREPGLLPLTGRYVLDVGCGDGAVLRDMLRYGALAEDLSGLDLLPERVERARELTPGARIELGDARALPFDDASQDVVLAFTLLSSVMETTARRKVASGVRLIMVRTGRRCWITSRRWPSAQLRLIRPIRT